MKLSPSGWCGMILSVLALALSSKVALAQFEPNLGPVTAPPRFSSAGPAGHGTAAHAHTAASPCLQPGGADWYASPFCDNCPESFVAERSAAGRLWGNPTGKPGGFFGGIDYLLLRPHFSEAIAFARGSQVGGMNMVQEPLDFDYQSSLRAMFGYRSAQGDTELRFTYWYIDSDTNVAAGNPGPGQFIVDPFGNMVGSAMVLDPGDTRFLTVIDMGGDSIATRASVRLNIFDLDMGVAVAPQNPSWSIDFTAGVRIAEVDQFYDSVIRDAGGDVVSRGDFTVDFVGAGPRLGSGLRRVFGQDRQFNVFAQGSGALLLGQYDLGFSNLVVGQGSGTQTQSMTRLIPVVDTEVGASWRMANGLTIAGGYLFQGWFDLGTSGGKFDGFFSGTDDANIMSFDGMFVRAEMAF